MPPKLMTGWMFKAQFPMKNKTLSTKSVYTIRPRRPTRTIQVLNLYSIPNGTPKAPNSSPTDNPTTAFSIHDNQSPSTRSPPQSIWISPPSNFAHLLAFSKKLGLDIDPAQLIPSLSLPNSPATHGPPAGTSSTLPTAIPQPIQGPQI
ncbi:hypothetical protein BT63DRAFT_463294 [Microthyrium microscopicum]|uniref:Uncharacterized protein n=1 Tax=Microthyrium microscopicum TaxID=703497 RepID=A0A6A6U5F6_9PEZI|nr:hypothetical protein BT63DRAFT_463294 [Microthyrium microscopicum]